MNEIAIVRTFSFFDEKDIYPEKFEVRLHTQELLYGMFEIVGRNINYTYDLLMGWGGMQCQYVDGTIEYATIHYKCQRVRDLFLEANKIVIVEGLNDGNRKTLLHY